MRSKNREEYQNKERHKEDVRAAKERRRNGSVLKAKEPTIQESPVVLIVCDGKNTEPNYFDQLRLRSVTVKTVGEGYNTISLVKRAIQLQQTRNYEKVWVVFDKDDFKDEAFHEAIQLAEQNGFGIAWSNQSFEYWLILHFEDHQGGGLHRKGYGDKINSYIDPQAHYDSEGSKSISENFFDQLESVDPKTGRLRRELATARAKRNHDYWLSIDHRPARMESCTLVYKLINYLMDFNKPTDKEEDSVESCEGYKCS
jgi:hypothetical protein